jgi:hypothetical protein
MRQNAGMRYVGIFLIGLALYGAFNYFTSRPIDWPAGVLAAEDPKQTDFEGGEPVAQHGFELLPRARFSAAVRVLSRESYGHDDLADVSPLDFAVGWGPMSDSAVIDELDISQSNRFYYWRFEDQPPIPENEIVRHSANWHLVPASDAIEAKMEDVRAGEIVELAGLLIDVRNPKGQIMRTSLTREDAGAGACEVILVQELSIRYR